MPSTMPWRLRTSARSAAFSSRKPLISPRSSFISAMNSPRMPAFSPISSSLILVRWAAITRLIWIRPASASAHRSQPLAVLRATMPARIVSMPLMRGPLLAWGRSPGWRSGDGRA